MVFVNWVLVPVVLLGALAFGWLNYLHHPLRHRFLFAFRAVFIAGLALLVFIPAIRRDQVEHLKPELRILLDASLSMSLSDALPTPRMERAQAIIAGLKGAYGNAFRISTWTFGATLKAAPDIERTKPTEPVTDLAGALRRITADIDQARVRGVFLLTDGADPSDAPITLWARTSPVPFYVVGVGKESYPYKDLSIDSLEAPEIAFKESSLSLAARIRSVGLGGRERIPVSFLAGSKRLGERTVELPAGGVVRFQTKPDHVGLVRYRVTVPELPGELSYRNNAREVAIFVEDKPREILLISGQPSFETAFLRAVLASDPRFALQVKELVLKGKTHDFSAADLAGQKLVILSRFAARDFKEGQLAALADYVQKGDGALLVMGTAPDDVDDLTTSDLSRVLPVTKPEGRWETPKRMNLILSPQGLHHPACIVLPHPQANLLAWKNLPPVLPAALLPVQAGEAMASTVLASFPFYPRDIIGIAYRFAGRGLTVYVNTCETHLLKLLPAAADDHDQVYPTFVANLLDWMTDPSRSAGVALIVPKLRYLEGETVELGVNDYQGLLAPGDVNLTVTREGSDKAMTLKLARSDDGIFGSFVPEQAGIYALSLPVPGKNVVERRILVMEDSRELERPFANVPLLKEVGAASGGAFFSEGDPQASRVALDASPLVVTTPSHVMWIDDPRLLTLLLVLLVAEWIIRRQRNLV